MARLVVSPGSPGAWEIHLKPGPNSLGRGLTNDFKIDVPSVSGSHCQVLVDHGHVLIKDLGSTNGTYVNRSPVKEAVLEPGQIVHLGGVEMLFQSDLARLQSAPEAPPAPPPPIPVSVMMPPVAPSEGIAVGSHNCKFHPKTPARYFCHKCNKYFCELCVTSRAQHRTCRQCGAECTSIQVQSGRKAERGFFASLPGA